MKQFRLLAFLLYGFLAWGQQEVPIDSLYKPDPKYLEDQFYFGISYVALRNLPDPLKQNGFSNSVKIGYIRDIPVNERRNIGFGVGLGLAWDNFYQNMRVSIDEETGAVQFKILTDDDSFRSNSFTLNKLEIPIEFRLRGSTPEKYKFWRLYTGLTLAYVYGTASEYVTDKVDVSYKNIKIINTWQWGIHLSAGYGTWNFNYYYGLTNIIKNDVEVNGQQFEMRDMRFGIIYYFL